jgi:hyperosmotically inducible protein
MEEAVMRKAHGVAAKIVGLCLAIVVNAEAARPLVPWTSIGQSDAQSPNPASAVQSQAANESVSPAVREKLIKGVRHAILMLPYYGMFDNIQFELQGRTVILIGQVARPTLKPDAENAVKRVEGVERVVNNIEVLPPSPMDERLRRQVQQAIYSYGPLFKYSHIPNPPIHVIVKNARVTLEGVVDTETDKQLCSVRANQVSGVLAVTNNLQVVKS